MKVLIVNTYDLNGGAARAAYRLYKALLSENVDCKMLVYAKTSDDHRVISSTGRKKRIFKKVGSWLEAFFLSFYKNRTKTLFSPSIVPFSTIVDEINKENPDVVNLQWICEGMLRIEDIAKINAPVVWTLQDMWAFTGGCHYDEECGAYAKSCGNCKVLGSQNKNDVSQKVFKRKEKTFAQLKNLRVVGVSHWLSTCAKRSSLFMNKQVLTLPNTIDTTCFKPHDTAKAKELWNLNPEKKYILFGAISAVSDPRKGFQILSKALELLKTKDVEFIVFGSSEPKDPQEQGFKINYVGQLHDDISLITLYSAVDVMIVPSIQEAFGQTASEAMACGTPVVAFKATGLIDIVDHHINGYLAQAYQPEDLANGIDWVLNNSNYKALCENARAKAVEIFDSKVVARQYIKLYQEIISK